jgi:soluble P-type ATPase
MLELNVPNWKHLRLEHLVLDISGTLTLDDELIPGVQPRIRSLSDQLDVHLIGADTSTALSLAEELGIELHLLNSEYPCVEQKAIYVTRLGAHNVVAIGGGADDSGMLYLAGLGIAVMSAEGLANEAMENADLVARDINDALDLLRHPLRLVASLRG